MKCICMPQVAELTAALPMGLPPVSVPPLPAGAADLAVSANAAAAMSAAAEMSAAGTLEAALAAGLTAPPLEAVLAMEAMAQVGGAMGIEMTAPSAAMDLSLAAGSLNVAAPALGELGAAMGPAMEPMSGLPMPLAVNAAIEGALGINMAAPGAAAALEASMAAAMDASASMSASAGMSMEAAMELTLAARAFNAAVALGLDPANPAAFAAALEASAALEVPPLSMSAGEMGELSAGLSDLGLISGAAGGLPTAAGMPAMEAQMAAMSANMEAAVDATASMSAEMSASAEANAAVGAALSAAAPMAAGGPPAISAAAALGGMDMSGLPSMGDMSIAASMAQSFEAASGMPLLSGVPCPNVFCVAGG